MSMADHRKLLKKHEKIFVGVLSPEGEVIDYTNEDNRKPDEPQPGLELQVFFCIFRITNIILLFCPHQDS